MARKPLPKISVIIPAHNEEESIPFVLADLPLTYLYDVVVVDNASTDSTAEQALRFAPKVRCVREDRPGYGQACLTGIASLKPDTEIVVFIDGDYSDFGEQLPRVAGPVIRGRKDFIVGSRARGRAERGSLTPVQVFGNWLATTLMWIIWGARWTDLGPFRAIRYDQLIALQMEDSNYGWTVEMQIKALRKGLRNGEVPVDYRKRVGFSKISGTISGSVKAGYKILYTIARYGFLR